MHSAPCNLKGHCKWWRLVPEQCLYALILQNSGRQCVAGKHGPTVGVISTINIDKTMLRLLGYITWYQLISSLHQNLYQHWKKCFIGHYHHSDMLNAIQSFTITPAWWCILGELIWFSMGTLLHEVFRYCQAVMPDECAVTPYPCLHRELIWLLKF